MTTSRIDLIREASSIGYAASAPSIVDMLIQHHWTDETALSATHDALAASIDSLVGAACFTLPWPLRLPNKWMKFSSDHSSVYARFFPAIIEYALPKTPLDVYSGWQPTNSFPVSRVAVSLPIVKRSRESYDAYLSVLEREPTRDTMVGRGRSGRLISLAEFEKNLVRDMREYVLGWIRSFLLTYPVACRDPNVREIIWLERFFFMTRSGRILLSTSEPVNLGNSGSAGVPCEPRHSDKSTAEGYSRFKHFQDNQLVPSVYEQYLLQSIRLAETGYPALAVVNAVMVLEWMSNHLIQEHCVRPVEEILKGVSPEIRSVVLSSFWTGDCRDGATGKTKHGDRRVTWWDRQSHYLPAAGALIDTKLQGELSRLILLRNDIIHNNPISIDAGVAHAAVEAAFKIARQWMESVLGSAQKRKSKRGS